jgi:hypothetical protein
MKVGEKGRLGFISPEASIAQAAADCGLSHAVWRSMVVQPLLIYGPSGALFANSQFLLEATRCNHILLIPYYQVRSLNMSVYSPIIWLPGAEPGTFFFTDVLDDWDAPVGEEEDRSPPPAAFLGGELPEE